MLRAREVGGRRGKEVEKKQEKGEGEEEEEMDER